MRFDDRLVTVLAQPRADAGARTAAWHQIVDLLAHRPGGDADPVFRQACAVLRTLRDEVPRSVRAVAAAAIADRPVRPALVALLADDHPDVAAALLGRVRLAEQTWLALLPRLSPAGRAALHRRGDLAPVVRAALAAAGRGDPAGSIAQADRDAPFRWEAGADGLIAWVAGAPRGPLIGASIAQPAARIDHGVDGQATGAFRQRDPFRGARLTVAGGSALAGEWRIAGVPLFDPASGRFTGYRGTARRPRPDEQAAWPGGAGLHGTGLPPDAVRQLAHELRTPLNAILGFGEMIAGQLLGPAAAAHRMRAGAIVHEGRRLLAAIDDLDLAARPAARPTRLIDPAGPLRRLLHDLAPMATARGVRIETAIAAGGGPVPADPDALDRMVARLLAAAIGLGGAGETITVALEDRSGAMCLRVSRPAILAGQDEHALLDPGYTPEGDWPDAPLLGLGFALRLIRNLATAAGGELVIGPAAFTLALPLAPAAGDAASVALPDEAAPAM